MIGADFLKCTVEGAGGVAGALVLAVAACSNGTPGYQSAERDQMQPISRAVFADGRLWLLHDDGSLASLAPNESEARPTKSSGRIVDLCKSAGRLDALVDGAGDNWILQQHSDGGWTKLASVPTEGDTFVALACENDTNRVTIVSNRRLVELIAGRGDALTLKQSFKEPLGISTAFATDAAIWVGFNVGEWGGGLSRISRSDGTVQSVGRNRSGELCGGPLNAACDPVNGIIAAPWNSACVVAAIGLVHWMSHGRIVEICGTNVRRLYFKPLDPQPPRNELDDDEPASTVAFFGVTRNGNTWWALGIDGLYRFEGAHKPEFRPFPKFENQGGYSVNFDIPGLALVLTDVNQRRSLSGSVPIMAEH